ncbi:hypothetical protein [Clostridium chrysemydis]|nr:hypothetical protein [Clostridium chrysemydis]
MKNNIKVLVVQIRIWRVIRMSISKSLVLIKQEFTEKIIIDEDI